MWQQPIALFPPPVPGALAWRKCRCKEASQTCKTFMAGRWSAWKVSDGEWEWASEWASGWVSEEEWAKPDWSLQSRQRISHWDPSSWKHWNGPAQWSIGACPLESRVVASWQRRCIGASQTCAIASSATPGVTRTCTREQPIEDIGSTGRVHESSRLCMAKLKLNGVRHVYQTCQADVKTCHLKAKNAS